MNSIDDFKETNPLKRKGKIFVKGIDERVSNSLNYIENEYPNFTQLELAIDFIEYHHSDAVKSDYDQIFSLGYFPATEAEMELDHALKHALIGSYKSAFADLRRALELTLTSIFLTSAQSNKKKALEWLTSKANTPFFSPAINSLLKEYRFKEFNEKQNWANNLKEFYWTLSDYSHNKGKLKGYRELNSTHYFISNTSAPSIKFETLLIFCDLFLQTVGEIVTMLALYNPMILVGVPLEEKYGLNGPMSGYYHTGQAELVHKLFPEKYKKYFQDLALNDDDIKSTVDFFNSLPDLTDEDIEEQVKQNEKFFKELGKDNLPFQK